MSQDVLQTKAGANAMGAPANASGFPAGFNYGREWGHVEGAAASCGGALYETPTPRTGTVPAFVTGNTVTHNGCGVAIVNPSTTAATGAIVQAGTVHGQHLTIINIGTATGTITMAAAGTSNVANGTGCIISVLAAIDLRWNALDSRWYQVRAA